MNFREFIENGGDFEGPVQLMLEEEERGQLEIALRYEPYIREDKHVISRKVRFLVGSSAVLIICKTIIGN